MPLDLANRQGTGCFADQDPPRELCAGFFDLCLRLRHRMIGEVTDFKPHWRIPPISMAGLRARKL